MQTFEQADFTSVSGITSSFSQAIKNTIAIINKKNLILFSTSINLILIFQSVLSYIYENISLLCASFKRVLHPYFHQ